MFCGVWLVIFVVFVVVFFGQNGVLVVFLFYVLGIVMVIFIGLMLKYIIMCGEVLLFVMELLVYYVLYIKSLIIQIWQCLKGFVLCVGKVIVIVSIFFSVLNSFLLSGKVVDNINDFVLVLVSWVIMLVFKLIGVYEDNWQVIVGLFIGVMVKEVVVGMLNIFYIVEDIQNEEFNLQIFSFGEELFVVVDEIWQGLKDIFSFSVLVNFIEVSKGDGEMVIGVMGVMGSKFGSVVVVYSYLIFVLFYIFCILVMGVIVCELSCGWMIFFILWGLNIVYLFLMFYYQIVSFSDYLCYSLVCILVVVLFNVVFFGLLCWVCSWVDVLLLVM